MDFNPKNKVLTKRLTLSIVAACLISFCGLLTETAVNIAFPKIMEQFSVSTATVQWLTTGNLLVVAMITPLSAFIQKRFPLRTLFFFSAACFIVGAILAAFSPNFTVLLLARLIQGVSTGIGVPLAFSIILEQVPDEKTGTYIGFGALVSAAAPALGPTFGGIITTTLGWKYIFILLIPILIFTIILGAFTIRECNTPKKIPLDILGAILVMLAFFCLVLGFANIGSIAQKPVFVIAALIVGVLCLLLFRTHCNRSADPLIQMDIFRNPSFVCHLVAFFLINAIMLGTAFLLPNYSQIVLGCISLSAGLILLPGALLNAGMGPLSGAILDRSGPKIPILTGMVLMTTSILLFSCFSMHFSVVLILVIYLVFGIGCGLAFGSTMTVGMMRLPMEQKTYGNSAFNTLMQFAGAVGTCVVAACVSLTQSTASADNYTEKTALGSTYGFLFLLVLSLIGLVLQIIGFYCHQKSKKKNH